MANSVNILLMYSTEAATTEHIERLKGLGKNIQVTVANSEKQALESASETEIILGHRYLWQVLPYANSLQWIQSSAAGINHLLVPDLWKQKPLLTRTPIFSDVIAWHALAMALSLLRGLPSYRSDIHSKNSQSQLIPANIPKVAMVFGLGKIGQELAKLLSSLGLKVIGIDRMKLSVDSCHQVLNVSNWKNHLSEVDLLFLCAPLTRETEKIINADILERLPRQAMVINVARGGLIDHGALINYLEQGKLAGAGLDVWDTVTDEQKSKLHQFSNVIRTPKIASFCADRQAKFEQFVEAQVQRYLKQEALLHVVDY